MTPRGRIAIFASIFACAAAGLLLWHGGPEMDPEDPATPVPPRKVSKSADTGRSKPEGGGYPAPGHPVTSRSIAEHGDRIRTELKAALDNRSSLAFAKACDELLYDYEGDPGEVLRDLEPYLNSSAADTRFLVARLFLRCGFENQRTIGILMELMKRPKPVPGHLDAEEIPDFRLLVAELLAEYRVAESADGIWELYRNTQELQLLVALAELQDRRAVGPILARRGELSRVTELPPLFGALKIGETRESMETLFTRLASRTVSENPEKIGLAWSLYQLTEQKKYLDFLIENRFRPDASKYLAGMTGPEIQPVLVELLYAQNGREETALLGLYLNHRDSPALKKYILEWLDINRKPRLLLNEDVLFRVASQFDDPEIEASAIRFSNSAYRDLWRFYREYRKDFPLHDLYRDRVEY